MAPDSNIGNLPILSKIEGLRVVVILLNERASVRTGRALIGITSPSVIGVEDPISVDRFWCHITAIMSTSSPKRYA